MTSTAVILAAGMGTRLGEHGGGRPKGFLELGERPIVEESLFRLRRAGVEQVVIVTGFERPAYEALAARHAGWVSTVHNPLFASSGSFYSLYCARDRIDGDFLLLESDLIYEQRALSVLDELAAADAVLVSGPTGAGDEVWVGTTDGRLAQMSKDAGSMSAPIAGELVGISKISAPLMTALIAIGERGFESGLMLDYETDGLVGVARQRPIACPVVADLLWAEIDDENHLARARSEIYPAILARDGDV